MSGLAQTCKAASGRHLQVLAEVLDPGVVIDAGQQNELGVIDTLDHVERQTHYHRAVAVARPQNAAPSACQLASPAVTMAYTAMGRCRSRLGAHG
jgi:hypothetical protein